MLEKCSSEGHLASQCPRRINNILSNNDHNYNEEPVDKEFEIKTKDVKKEPMDAIVEGQPKGMFF